MKTPVWKRVQNRFGPDSYRLYLGGHVFGLVEYGLTGGNWTGRVQWGTTEFKETFKTPKGESWENVTQEARMWVSRKVTELLGELE